MRTFIGRGGGGGGVAGGGDGGGGVAAAADLFAAPLPRPPFAPLPRLFDPLPRKLSPRKAELAPLPRGLAEVCGAGLAGGDGLTGGCEGLLAVAFLGRLETDEAVAFELDRLFGGI